MGGHEAQSYWEGVGLMMLIGGLLIGPAVWFLDLQISYAAVKWACEHDRRGVILALPLASLAIIACSAWMSWSAWRKLQRSGSQEGGRVEDRSYFLALAGLGLNAVFALLILASFAPRYLLSPCE